MELKLTPQNERRLSQFIREWKAKSKTAGDYWWRKVHQITGEGDYICGQDEGGDPAGFRE